MSRNYKFHNPEGLYFIIFVFLLVTLVTVSGCKPSLSVQGKYRPVVSMSPNALMLVIKPKHTFSFTAWSDILGEEILNGTWKLSNKKLQLTEDFLVENKSKIKDSIISVVEEFHNDKSNISIKAIDATDNSPLVGVDISVNDDITRYITDTTGTVTVKAIKALNSIRFSYFSIKKTITIKYPSSNTVTLKLQLQNLPTLKWLKLTKTWTKKGNKLVPLTDEGIQDKQGTLVKY